jgi:DNA-binding HxlR family transcriptional regulator
MSGDNRQEDLSRIELFEALGHPMRVKIIEALNVSPLGFADLKRKVGIESSGHLSFHLNKLGNLVRIDSEGNYSLTDDGREALRLLDTVGEAKYQAYHSPTNVKEWWEENKKVIAVAVIVIVIAGLSIFAYNSYYDYQSQRQVEVFAFEGAIATSSVDLTRSIQCIENNDSANSIQMLGASSVLVDDVLNNYMYISDDYSLFLSSTMGDRQYIASTLTLIADNISDGTGTNEDTKFISDCANATWFLSLSLFPIGPQSLLEQFKISNLTTNIDNFHTLNEEALSLRGYG